MSSRRRSYQARTVASAGVGGGWGSDVRASLGDVHIENACDKINKLMVKTANLMVPYSPSRESVLPMLFADDTLVKLKAVRGMVTPNTLWKKYRVTADVDLQIGFQDAIVPTIQPEFLFVQPDRASPLLNAIEEVRAIYVQFEKVKHVLRWLNRYATAGAIRHYWPAALKLCPDSPALKELSVTPARFSSPPNIGEMLQLIRESAATMSASILLPSDAMARVHKELALYFVPSLIIVGTHEFKTDEMIIYLN